MKKKVFALLLASMMVVGAVTGCQSSSGDTAEPSGEETTETTTETTESAEGEETAEGTYHLRVGHVLANTHPYQ